MVSSHQLGQFLRQARQRAGLTQDGLSDKAGLAYSTLAKIEQGSIKSPSFFTVFALVKALGIDFTELQGITETAGDSPTADNSSQKIEFIYFDMNGVLVRFYHRAFTAISRETNRNLNLVETAFWHYRDAYDGGKMTAKQFNEAYAKRLGVNKLDWKEHYMRAVEPVKELDEFVEEIHGKYQIGLLTDTSPGFVKEMMERRILPNVGFDTIIDSSETGLLKSGQRIYELAEKKSGHHGSEILFIDDSRANLAIAERLGWQVIWFNTFEPEESVKELRRILGK